MGKQTQTNFLRSERKSKDLLEIIRTDICGPMRNQTIGGCRYFALFIDDYSRWCEVKFLSKKSEVFAAFKDNAAYAKNFTGKKIKNLQSDNGTEYLSNEFEDFLKDRGIKRRLSIPHTPQQNGIAERKNRTLLETARCLMLQSRLPARFWGEAVNTANYIRNRCPSKSLDGETAYKYWNGKPPMILHLKPFGSLAMALDKNPNKGKFDQRSKECYFLGYSEESKAYRLWSITEEKIIRSRDIKILEKFCNGKEKVENLLEVQNIDIDPTINSLNPTSTSNYREEQSILEENEGKRQEAKRGPGRSKIIRTGKPGRPRKSPNIRISNIEEPNSVEILDPKSLYEALEGPDADE